MSKGRSLDPASLERLATRWLAAKKLARPSASSDAARRADLAVIASLIADASDRNEDLELPSFARQLSRIEPADLTAHVLQDAFASFGVDHASSSVRRVLSSWRGFTRWLLAEGVLASDPIVRSRGPAGRTGNPSRSTWRSWPASSKRRAPPILGAETRGSSETEAWWRSSQVQACASAR